MSAIIDHILDLLSRGLPYEEKPGLREKDPPIRTATIIPLGVRNFCFTLEKIQSKNGTGGAYPWLRRKYLGNVEERSAAASVLVACLQQLFQISQATVALSEMFKVEEAAVPVMNNYHRLLVAVMIRVASSVSVKAPAAKSKVGETVFLFGCRRFLSCVRVVANFSEC